MNNTVSEVRSAHLSVKTSVLLAVPNTDGRNVMTDEDRVEDAKKIRQWLRNSIPYKTHDQFIRIMKDEVEFEELNRDNWGEG